MKFRESVEAALRSARPLDKLRLVAQEFLSIGTPREQVFDLFDHTRLELRKAGREADEDAVADVMDFIDGWCSPHMRIEEQPEPKAFQWTYPVYYIAQGASCAALASPDPNGRAVGAIAVFTDLALAEQFMRLRQVKGTPAPLNIPEEFLEFLRRILPPATLVAFNPPGGNTQHMVVKVCVKICTLMQKLQSQDASIAIGKDSEPRELVLSAA